MDAPVAGTRATPATRATAHATALCRCAGVLECHHPARAWRWHISTPALASWPDPQPCTCPGEVIEVNESLNDDPSLVNSSAEGDGWMTKVP